jgi:hypothetical protein
VSPHETRRDGGRTAVPSPPPPGPDLIGVALGALASGATAGAGVVTVALAGLRGRLEHFLPPIVFAGIVTAALVAWHLARPITDWWRRGLTAALGVFAALLLTVLSAPADMIGGFPGLLTYSVALLTAAGMAARHALRSRVRGG